MPAGERDDHACLLTTPTPVMLRSSNAPIRASFQMLTHFFVNFLYIPRFPIFSWLPKYARIDPPFPSR